MNRVLALALFVLLALSSLSFAATRAEAEAAISAADLAIYTAQQAGKDTGPAEAKLLEATRRLTSDYDSALNLAVEAKRLAETAPSATQTTTAGTGTAGSQSAGAPATTTPAPTTPAPTAPADSQAPAETVNIPAATGPAEEPVSVGIDWLMVISLLLVPVVVLLALFGMVWFFFLRKRY